MRSTNYVVIFVLCLTSVAALAIAGLYTALKDAHQEGELVFKKKGILAAVNGDFENFDALTDADINKYFDERVSQKVIDMSGNPVEGLAAIDVDMKAEGKKPEEERNLPVFIYKNGDKAYHIIAVRGNGLWDAIWGNIAVQSDGNTIAGTSFDHVGETPGLGAEIKDNPAFPASFIGDKLYDAEGNYVSVSVRKGLANKDDLHGVDGITGATITANGVTEMMVRGVKYYEPYLASLK